VGAHDFAFDGANLFFSDYLTIHRVSLSDGTRTDLPVENLDATQSPGEIAIHGSYIYFSLINNANLYRVAADGSKVSELVGTFPASRQGADSNGIAWIGGRVYWAFDNLVVSAPSDPTDGGESVMTEARASKPYAILLGASSTAIVWNGSSEGFVRTIPSTSDTTLYANPPDIRIGAFDGETLFAVQNNAAGNPHIVAVPVSGGPIVDLAAAGSGRMVSRIFATGRHVYRIAMRPCGFTCGLTCEALRIDKP
jgi:hypothetical protein